MPTIWLKPARVRARPTSGGVTIAFDPYGRTIGSVSTVDDAVRSITLWVPKSRVPTLYAWVGDVVGQVAGLGLLLLIGLRIKRRAR